MAKISSRGPAPACPGYSTPEPAPKAETTPFQINIVAKLLQAFARSKVSASEPWSAAYPTHNPVQMQMQMQINLNHDQTS